MKIKSPKIKKPKIQSNNAMQNKNYSGQADKIIHTNNKDLKYKKKAAIEKRKLQDRQRRQMDDKDLEGLSKNEIGAIAAKETTMAFLEKSIGKRMPIVGAAISMDEINDYIKKDDISGAALATASMAASQFPVVGTAAGIAIDTYLSVREIEEEALNEEQLAQFYMKEDAERQGIENFKNEQILILTIEDAERLAIKAEEEARAIYLEQEAKVEMERDPKDNSSKIKAAGAAALVVGLAETMHNKSKQANDPIAMKRKGAAVKEVFASLGKDPSADKEEKQSQEALGGDNPGMGNVQTIATDYARTNELVNSRNPGH